jgi:hypothetical protein
VHTDPCETYRRHLRLWGAATLVEAAVLAIGLLVTESLDVGLYDPAFTGVLYFSLFVLVPLMVTTPVSLLVTAVYAMKYRRRCP